ncbi:hypothetical protein BDZ89DRAFT_1243818 [Hymenopellis radicata]|nr:hypothetical protein BDZ89DRAFT_1243818 [Hymenopellis radicata]
MTVGIFDESLEDIALTSCTDDDVWTFCADRGLYGGCPGMMLSLWKPSEAEVLIIATFEESQLSHKGRTACHGADQLPSPTLRYFFFCFSLTFFGAGLYYDAYVYSSKQYSTSILPDCCAYGAENASLNPSVNFIPADLNPDFIAGFQTPLEQSKRRRDKWRQEPPLPQSAKALPRTDATATKSPRRMSDLFTAAMNSEHARADLDTCVVLEIEYGVAIIL